MRYSVDGICYNLDVTHHEHNGMYHSFDGIASVASIGK